MSSSRPEDRPAVWPKTPHQNGMKIKDRPPPPRPFLVHAMSAWLVKTCRAPSRHCRGMRGSMAGLRYSDCGHSLSEHYLRPPVPDLDAATCTPSLQYTTVVACCRYRMTSHITHHTTLPTQTQLQRIPKSAF